MRFILNPASRMMVETKYPQAIFPSPGMVAVPLKSHGCPSQQRIMAGRFSSNRSRASARISDRCVSVVARR